MLDTAKNISPMAEVDELFKNLNHFRQSNPAQYEQLMKRTAMKALIALKRAEHRRSSNAEPSEFEKQMIHLQAVKCVDSRLYESQKSIIEQSFNILI